MTTAKVTAGGQVTIPENVLADLGLDVGSSVEFVQLSKGRYAIVAAATDVPIDQQKYPVTALKGILRKPKKPVSIEDMNEAIAEEAAKAADDRY